MRKYHVPFWRAAALVRESLTLIILSAYLSRYVDPKTETLSIQLARNGWLGMEKSLLHGWQNGSNQFPRTEASPKSPAVGGTEEMCSNLIAREESEPIRVNETRVVS
jgi:putative transposase